MPEILVAAVAAVGVYKGYQMVSKKMKVGKNWVQDMAGMKKVAAKAKKARPTLKKDPVSGVYRPQ